MNSSMMCLNGLSKETLTLNSLQANIIAGAYVSRKI